VSHRGGAAKKCAFSGNYFGSEKRDVVPKSVDSTELPAPAISFLTSLTAAAYPRPASSLLGKSEIKSKGYSGWKAPPAGHPQARNSV
jgi:hypothetical protein